MLLLFWLLALSMNALFPTIRRMRRPLVAGESLSDQVQRLTADVALLTKENTRLVAELASQKAKDLAVCVLGAQEENSAACADG